MAETPFSPDSTPEETDPVDARPSSIASPASSSADAASEGGSDLDTVSDNGPDGDTGADQADAAVAEEPLGDAAVEAAGAAFSAGVESIATAAVTGNAPAGASTADPESAAVADVTPGAASEPSAPQAASPAPEPEVMAESPFPPALSEPEAIAAPQASEAEQQTPPEAAASEAAPSPAPEIAPAAEPAAGIAATIAVPPLDSSSPAAGGEGGEWELLVGKLNTWFSSGELNRQWQKIRGPLKGLAILIGVILALRLYASVVGTVDRIPVVSGLLELIGLIALGHFGLTKMVRTSEREKVLTDWKQRWLAFRGQD